MVLEELHDQGPALVQGTPQGRVWHLLIFQLPEHILRFRTCTVEGKDVPLALGTLGGVGL